MDVIEKDDVEKARSPCLYNLAWNTLKQTVTTKKGKRRTIYGALYFDGNANLFDQLLVSRPMLTRQCKLSVDEQSMQIETHQEMVSDSKNEGPIPFGLPTKKNLNQGGPRTTSRSARPCP